MDFGISAGAGIEADLRPPRADAPQSAVTEHILAVADQAGFGAALIDAAAGSGEASLISWPQFAHMVRASARGLSNRQIADELVISPATAARHVANILSKLGFTSRTQIASWAARHEPPS